MYYFFTWTTGHTEVNTYSPGRVSWKAAIHIPDAAAIHLDALDSQNHPADRRIPPMGRAVLLCPTQRQVLLAFAWLHWCQQSTPEDQVLRAGCYVGQAFRSIIASLLKVLTNEW